MRSTDHSSSSKVFDVSRPSPGTFAAFEEPTVSDRSATRLLWQISLERDRAELVEAIYGGRYTREHARVITDTILSSGTVDPTASFCPVLRWLGGRVGELRGRRRWRRDWIRLVVPHAVYLQYFIILSVIENYLLNMYFFIEKNCGPRWSLIVTSLLLTLWVSKIIQRILLIFLLF